VNSCTEVASPGGIGRVGAIAAENKRRNIIFVECDSMDGRAFEGDLAQAGYHFHTTGKTDDGSGGHSLGARVWV